MTQTTTPTYYGRRLVLYVKELWRRREFIWFLAMGNFKGKSTEVVELYREAVAYRPAD
jgi:hypothetical protein